MPVIVGIVALLATFVVMWWVPALYASGGGIMIVGILAQAVGTSVAMVLDLPQGTRSARAVGRRLGIALAALIIMWFAVMVIFTAFAHGLTPLYVSMWELVLILTFAIAYGLIALITHRIEPAWARYGGVMGAVSVALVIMITLSLASYAERNAPPGAPRGGPNMPMPTSPPQK